MKSNATPPAHYNYSTTAQNMPYQGTSQSAQQSSSSTQRRPRASSDAMRQQQLLSQQGSSAQDGLHATARAVYEKERLFHGTDKNSAASIRQNGFRAADKTAFTEVGTKPTHYFTGDKKVAASFAQINGRGAALVRTMGAHTNKHTTFERDSYMSDRTAVHTKDDVAPKHVLGSKRSAPGKDAEVFQRRLKDEGVKVDLKTAGELLRDVQSDDEDGLR